MEGLRAIDEGDWFLGTEGEGEGEVDFDGVTGEALGIERAGVGVPVEAVTGVGVALGLMGVEGGVIEVGGTGMGNVNSKFVVIDSKGAGVMVDVNGGVAGETGVGVGLGEVVDSPARLSHFGRFTMVLDDPSPSLDPDNPD